MSPTLSNLALLMSNCSVFLEKQLSWSSFWQLIGLRCKFWEPTYGLSVQQQQLLPVLLLQLPVALGQDPLLSRVMTVGTMALGCLPPAQAHTIPTPLCCTGSSAWVRGSACVLALDIWEHVSGATAAKAWCTHWPRETGIQLPLLGYPKGFKLLLLKGSWNRRALKGCHS